MNAPLPARRRVLRLIAGGVGAVFAPSFPASATVTAYEWRGRALGAAAAITLFEPDRAKAERVLSSLLDEVSRLECCFSLFDPGSEIARLNTDGRLDRASPDFRALLAAALDMAAASDGAFDPTVQPLWRYLADCARDRRRPVPADIEGIVAGIGYRGVVPDGARVRFARPGMALTLNGIAQGYITDRAADLLRDLGYGRVLVQLGETVAWAPPDQPGWRVDVPHPSAAGRTIGHFDVADGAVATSSGAALRFDDAGDRHHLLDARTGASPRHWQSVAVQAPCAVVADGLSTALAVAPPARFEAILRRYPDTRALALSQSGTVHRKGRAS